VPDGRPFFALMELWRRNLYSLWFAQFIAAAGLSMFIPFLPFYLRELGVVEKEAVKIWSGFIFAAPFMVAACLQPIWGILGDRHGRKPMVVRAMLGLALANFLMGFAQSAPQLLILRFFQGSLSGFVAPSLALMASCTPREKIGQALGTLQSALVTGMILGPLLGGVLSHFMGYRPLFFWTGFFCLSGAFIVIRLVKEEFVRREKEKKSGLREHLHHVFNSPELRVMLVLSTLVQSSIVIVAPFLSLYVEYLKVSPDYIGLITGVVFGIAGVANAITAPLWGKRADRVGYRKILRLSLAGLTVFTLPQALVGNVYQLLFLRAGLGGFASGVIPTINTIVQRSTPEKDRGGIYGIFQSGLLLGNVGGPLIGGFLAASLGLRAIFLITAGIFGLALLWERRAGGGSQLNGK
jgi:DHA1 family multidrug resistance protein-like MFS transporter